MKLSKSIALLLILMTTLTLMACQGPQSKG